LPARAPSSSAVAQANRTKVYINIDFWDARRGRKWHNGQAKEVEPKLTSSPNGEKTNRQINRKRESTKSMTQCCNKAGGTRLREPQSAGGGFRLGTWGKSLVKDTQNNA